MLFRFMLPQFLHLSLYLHGIEHMAHTTSPVLLPLYER